MLDETKEVTEATPDQEPVVTAGGEKKQWLSPRQWLLLGFLLLFAIVISAASYVYVEFKQLSASIAKVQQESVNNHQQIAQSQPLLQKLQDDIDKQREGLLKQEQTLMKLSGPRLSAQARLGEMSYLINLANYSLVFSKDIATSQQLLILADQIVVESKDASYIALRKAIEDDLGKLKSQEVVDVTGLFIKLGQLENTVGQASLIGTKLAAAKKGVKLSADESNMGWQQQLRRSWQELKSLIVIHKQTGKLVPLVALQGADYIYQYIYLQIGQAQWALLHRDNVIYQQCLQQAKLWVQKYFVSGDDETQKALLSIDELKKQDISVASESLAASLRAVSDLN